MSVNEDFTAASSDSFWEVGKYSRTVKRIDNGFKLCESLRQLIESRSDIEKSYAKQLSQWSRKWNEYLDKGPEHGTTQAAWRGVLTEADQLCELHTEIAENLMTTVYSQIKQWQKENYHKSMMHFKETKEKEDGFRKAQKPWMKRLNKVMSAKKDYHNACKQEKSTVNQENNAKGDPSFSQDQVKKIQEKLEKCQSDVETMKNKYQTALNDLNSYNAKYIEEMTLVFNDCQDYERKRLGFFKKIFFDFKRSVDLSSDSRYGSVYSEFNQTVTNADAEKDLRWWSNNHGAGMSMNWPEFEEYSPELHNITHKSKKSGFESTEGITITSIKHSRESSYASNSSDMNPLTTVAQPCQEPPANTSVASSSNYLASKQEYDESLNPFGDDSGEVDDQTSEDRQLVKEGAQKKNSEADGRNPFGEQDGDDWEAEEEDVTLVDDNRPGVPVRALYDYFETDGDELSFKAGDVFTKLTDVDEMGWCKGRKDGRVGLYPASYVEPL